MTGTARGTVGYSVVLPPGWAQIPLDERAPQVVAGLVERAFDDVPPDVPPDTVATLRHRLEGHLARTLDAARATGATELYLPTERIGGILVPASFVVVEHVPEQGLPEGVPAEETAVRLVARWVADDADARPVDVDGAPAVRTESRAEPDPDRTLGVRAASRRVDYLVPVPDPSGRWLAISCTVLEAADDTDDLAGLLVELFDAVMTTFRWDAA